MQKNANQPILVQSSSPSGSHIKRDTLKLIEERVGMNLEHMGTREKFLDIIPMAYALRTRINK